MDSVVSATPKPSSNSTTSSHQAIGSIERILNVSIGQPVFACRRTVHPKSASQAHPHLGRWLHQAQRSAREVTRAVKKTLRFWPGSEQQHQVHLLSRQG